MAQLTQEKGRGIMPRPFFYYQKMITVKTKINVGKFGMGLFSDQKIEKGSVVWKNNTDSEIFITQKDFENKSDYAKQTIRHYGYFDKHELIWKLPIDNARFMNHSNTPNLLQDLDGNSIAAFDIEPDTELFCDYSLFENIEDRGIILE